MQPKNTKILINKGIVLTELKKTDESMNLYSEIIQIDSNCYSAYNNKGVIMFNQKKYEECLELFEKAIDWCPQYYHAVVNLGVTYGEL